MSQLWRALGSDALVLVDATAGNETVTLTRMASGRQVTVRRADSAVNTVTVVVTSGLYLDGVLNGTTTVTTNAQKQFIATDGGFESFGGGPVVSVDADGSLMVDGTTVELGTDSDVSGKLTAASNLSDLTNAATARTNLGLGAAATMTPATIAADAALTGTYVRNDASSLDFGPLVNPVEKVEATAWLIQSINGIAYGYDLANPAKLLSSIDDGATWQLVSTLPAGVIIGLHINLSGEMVAVTSAAIYVSTGWATNPATATWTSTATRTSNGGTNPAADFIASTWDAWGNFILVAEYVSPDRTNSRYVRLSTDGGLTWANKFDLNTRYPGQESLTHIHGVAIDPYHSTTSPRLWLTHGDGPLGVFFSDDLGSTWTLIVGSDASGGVSPQMMTITAAPAGVVLTTDANSPDGVYRILRKPVPSTMALECIYRLAYTYSSGTLLGFGTRSWRDPKSGYIYMTWQTSSPSLTTPAPTFLFVSDGARASLVWSSVNTAAAGETVISDGVAVTSSGKVLIGYRAHGGTRYLVSADAPSRGGPSYADMNSGNVLDGTAVTRDAVAVGVESVARGLGVMVGASAVQAASTQKGVGVGVGVAVGEASVAVGYQAGGATARTFGVAVGATSTLTDNESTAVGHGASSGVYSVAVGRAAIAGGGYQAAIGGGAAVHASALGAVAIGYAATVPSDHDYATAIGTQAKAEGAAASAIGAGAEATGQETTSIGRHANATSVHAVAIGVDAQATHYDTVALGWASATSDPMQVAVGARHFEINESLDPPAPAANRARLYVRDNGSGKTQLCVRFPTGAVQVLAVEP